jgi:tRNA U38,U39,U40 pseudouridine synthase TruA
MPQPEIRDEAQWIAVHLPHSSVIAAAAYESLDGKAHIRFKQSRKVYEYNLPWYEFTRLVNAASAGSYYNRAIKGYFDAVEVTGESVLG